MHFLISKDHQASRKYGAQENLMFGR